MIHIRTFITFFILSLSARLLYAQDLTAVSADKININPEHQNCEMDSQCTTIETSCKNEGCECPVAVNRQHYQMYAQMLQDCRKRHEHRTACDFVCDTPYTVCLNKHCTLSASPIKFIPSAMNSRNENSTQGNRRTIVPEKVSLSLSTPDPLIAELEIELSVLGMNTSGCASAGQLKLTKKETPMRTKAIPGFSAVDDLELEIVGYEITLSPGNEEACPAELPTARAQIVLPELKTNEQMWLKITLNHEINNFLIKNENNVIYLDAANAVNVISMDPRENAPSQAMDLGFMTSKFTEQLVQARIEGTFSQDSDLLLQLRSFLKKKGLEPLDEKLRNYQPANSIEKFIVYVPMDQNIDQLGYIGNCSYTETIGGPKTIKVSLKKVKVYPFFKRSRDSHQYAFNIF